MSEYDNRRSGFAWRVNEGDCIARGSIIDAQGNSKNMALLKHTTKNGKNLLRIMVEAGQPYTNEWQAVEAGMVWVQAGTLFRNETDNERAPKFTGSYSVAGMDRVSCWTGEKDGKAYMSLKFQPPFNKEGDYPSATSASAASGGGAAGAAATVDWGDDDIPF